MFVLFFLFFLSLFCDGESLALDQKKQGKSKHLTICLQYLQCIPMLSPSAASFMPLDYLRSSSSSSSSLSIHWTNFIVLPFFFPSSVMAHGSQLRRAKRLTVRAPNRFRGSPGVLRLQETFEGHRTAISSCAAWISLDDEYYRIPGVYIYIYIILYHGWMI